MNQSEQMQEALAFFNSLDWSNKGKAVDSILLHIPHWEAQYTSSDTLLDDIYHKLAIYYYNTDAYPEAILWYKKELSLHKSNTNPNHSALANCYFGLVASLIETYSFTEANQLLVEQGADFKKFKVNQAHLLADYHYNSGVAAYEIGDFLKCTERCELALTFFEKANQDKVFNRELCLLRLGAAYDNLQLPQKAIEQYQSAFQTFKKQGFEYGIALCRHNLGISYRMLAKPDSAIDHLNAALTFNSAALDTVEIARNTVDLAQVYYLKGEWAKAKELTNRSLTLRKQKLPAWHKDIIECYLMKGNLAYELGDLDEAEIQFRKAGKAASAGSVTYLQIEPLSALAEVLCADSMNMKGKEKAHRIYSSLDSLILQTRQNFPSNASRIRFSAKVQSIYEAALGNALQLYKSSGVLDYFDAALHFCSQTKALALRETLQNEVALNFAGMPDSLLQHERDLRLKLLALNEKSWLYTEGSKELKEIKDEVILVKAAQERSIKEMELNYPSYYTLKYAAHTGLKSAAIQKELDDKSQFVEYFVGKNALYALSLTKNAISVHTHRDVQTIKNEAESFLQSIDIEDGDSKDFAYSAHELYKLLFGTLLEKNPSISKLKIVPDGLLYQIPFDALCSSHEASDEQPSYLLNKYSIGFLNSQTEIKRKASKTFSWSGVDFAGLAMDFKDSKDENLPPLEFALEEVNAINDILNGQVFLNEELNYSNFSKSIASADIVHICTHGIYSENRPLQSKLYLSGEGNQNEISVNRMYAEKTNASLIYLSACQTARGQILSGEGILGFSRALTFAGAKSQIMSLWNISDKSASDIATNFYKNIKDGLSKDEALQKAKLDYINNCQTSIGQQPYFWAAPVLLGASEPIYSSNSVLNILCLLGVALLLYLLAKRYNPKKEER